MYRYNNLPSPDCNMKKVLPTTQLVVTWLGTPDAGKCRENNVTQIVPKTYTELNKTGHAYAYSVCFDAKCTVCTETRSDVVLNRCVTTAAVNSPGTWNARKLVKVADLETCGNGPIHRPNI